MATTIDRDNSTWQRLMNGAYDKWKQNDGMLYGRFLFSLSGPERIAVLFGNYNYQVENGGHRQWVDNGYGQHVNDLLMAVETVRSDDGTTVPERTMLDALADRLRKLSGYLDLNVKNQGFFGDYWVDERDADDPEAQTDGEQYADSLDDWYYDDAQPVILPVVERFLVKVTANGQSQVETAQAAAT